MNSYQMLSESFLQPSSNIINLETMRAIFKQPKEKSSFQKVSEKIETTIKEIFLPKVDTIDVEKIVSKP